MDTRNIPSTMKKLTNFSIQQILSENSKSKNDNKSSCTHVQEVDLRLQINCDNNQMKLNNDRPLNKVLENPWCSSGPIIFTPKLQISHDDYNREDLSDTISCNRSLLEMKTLPSTSAINNTYPSMAEFPSIPVLENNAKYNTSLRKMSDETVTFEMGYNHVESPHLLPPCRPFSQPWLLYQHRQGTNQSASSSPHHQLPTTNVPKLIENYQHQKNVSAYSYSKVLYVKTELKQNNFKCKNCHKLFTCPETLKTHEKSHKSPRYECNECGKGFSQLRNYKYHISIHKGTKEFAAHCPECGKMFNDKGYLSSHLKIHRNKKEYVCPHCPKSFNQRVAFNMHVRIHTGIKPHKCTECGKRFSRKMLLKQHLRTHSGEKPYECTVCGKTFADRSNMTLHQRLHSGIKPFLCPICPKAFTKKHHLKTHLNYHTGFKPYVCPHPNCGQSFTQSSNMRTHAKKCQFKPD